MGLIAGSTLLIHAARLINDLTKEERQTGYVVVERSKGKLRTRYRIVCSNRRPSDSLDSKNKNDDNKNTDTFLILQVKNPQLVSQRLLQRYAKGADTGDWFSLNKKQLNDLEEVAVLIYAATG